MTKKALAALRAQIAREMKFESCGGCSPEGWVSMRGLEPMVMDDTTFYEATVVRCRCFAAHQAKVDARLAEAAKAGRE